MLNKFDRRAFGWYANFDGCAYYRITKPMEALSDNLSIPTIWGTDVGRLLPVDWPDYDVVIGQRICMGDGNGNGPADQWANQITQDNDVMSVYELDDDLFNVDPSNPAYEFFSDPPVQQNMRVCIQKADMVTVSTEPLRQQMLKYNPNVKTIPNFIDSDVLYIQRKNIDSNKVVIGWAGSQTHQMDFAPMAEELGLAMALNPKTRFMTIGANYSHGLPMDRVRHLSWIHSTRRIYPRIAEFDIGIAPLAPSKFNESKSYIKALEYAALGIPCVASNFGPYADFVDHGVTGFLVSKPGDWKEYVSLLANDVALRIEMGERARIKAFDFTIQSNAWRWDMALNG